MNSYATLGPACMTEDTLCAMLRLGLTGFRLNLSHTALKDCAAWLEMVQQAAAKTGTKPEIIMDMRGSELRIGALTAPMALHGGDSVLLGAGGIPVEADILAALTPAQEILLDDALIALTAERPEGDGYLCRCIRGGTLGSRKSITLTGIEIPRSAVSPEDHADYALAAQYGITGIMQPFVRCREDLMEVRQAMAQHGIPRLTLFAKAEDEIGVRNLPNWMALADVVTVARGDLGSNLPLWTLPRTQKHIARLCRAQGKPFLVVTQLLATMIDHPTPTRAEVSDIYNACLDGASALMLTNETAQGRYPVESVDWLLRVAHEGEQDR